ncbi:MAG: DNA-directed RNA polymerase subunit omega [Verrucomicrobiota bacterium]
MNADLLNQALQVVPETGTLVNMVRLRVRQLAGGHRALILAPPGMGNADIALSEIVEGKITSEATEALPPADAPVLAFPATPRARKAA